MRQRVCPALVQFSGTRGHLPTRHPPGLFDPDDADPASRQVVGQPTEIACIGAATGAMPQNQRGPRELGGWVLAG